MPGTGKTATVREVIRDLKKDYSFDVRELLYDLCIVFRNQWNEGDFSK